jgi:hypothetical protein
MFSLPEPAKPATYRSGLALVAAILLLGMLVHFGADLTWLYRHAATQVTAQSLSGPLAGNSERLTLADPDGDVALLPRAASVPWRSTIAVRGMLVPSDRVLPPLPLFHPPALNSHTLFAHL